MADDNNRTARDLILESLPVEVRLRVIEQTRNQLNDDDPTWASILAIMSAIDRGFDSMTADREMAQALNRSIAEYAEGLSQVNQTVERTVEAATRRAAIQIKKVAEEQSNQSRKGLETKLEAKLKAAVVEIVSKKESKTVAEQLGMTLLLTICSSAGLIVGFALCHFFSR